MKSLFKKESGFTIVELLIAAFLTSLITFVAMDAYLTQHQQFLVQEQVSDMQQRCRATLDDISFNLRQSGFNNPDSLVSYRVGLAANGPDTLEINHHGNNIYYYIDASDSTHPNLIKSINGNVQIFADDVEGFELTVLGTYLVEVQITARSASIDEHTAKDYRRRTYTARVNIRNI